MKRTLSLVLALSMLLCGVAFAEDAATPEESYTYNLALGVPDQLEPAQPADCDGL